MHTYDPSTAIHTYDQVFTELNLIFIVISGITVMRIVVISPSSAVAAYSLPLMILSYHEEIALDVDS
jgi:hypothetical protein